MAHHHLKASGQTCHWGFFDATLKPRLTIRSGDSVTIDTRDRRAGSASPRQCGLHDTA